MSNTVAVGEANHSAGAGSSSGRATQQQQRPTAQSAAAAAASLVVVGGDKRHSSTAAAAAVRGGGKQQQLQHQQNSDTSNQVDGIVRGGSEAVAGPSNVNLGHNEEGRSKADHSDGPRVCPSGSGTALRVDTAAAAAAATAAANGLAIATLQEDFVDFRSDLINSLSAISATLSEKQLQCLESRNALEANKVLRKCVEEGKSTLAITENSTYRHAALRGDQRGGGETSRNNNRNANIGASNPPRGEGVSSGGVEISGSTSGAQQSNENSSGSTEAAAATQTGGGGDTETAAARFTNRKDELRKANIIIRGLYDTNSERDDEEAVKQILFRLRMGNRLKQVKGVARLGRPSNRNRLLLVYLENEEAALDILARSHWLEGSTHFWDVYLNKDLPPHERKKRWGGQGERDALSGAGLASVHLSHRAENRHRRRRNSSTNSGSSNSNNRTRGDHQGVGQGAEENGVGRQTGDGGVGGTNRNEQLGDRGRGDEGLGGERRGASTDEGENAELPSDVSSTVHNDTSAYQTLDYIGDEEGEGGSNNIIASTPSRNANGFNGFTGDQGGAQDISEIAETNQPEHQGSELNEEAREEGSFTGLSGFTSWLLGLSGLSQHQRTAGEESANPESQATHQVVNDEIPMASAESSGAYPEGRSVGGANNSGNEQQERGEIRG